MALLVVQLAFASQAVESKLAMSPRALGGEGMAPHAVALIRMVGAALIFQCISIARRTPVPVWRDQLRLAGLSMLGIVLNQLLFLAGLQRTTSAVAALLAVVIPVASATLAVVFRKEAFSWHTALGLGLAASGIVYLTGIQHVDSGALLIATNCFFYAAYVVFSRDVIARLSAMTVVTWIFTWGAALFAPFSYSTTFRTLHDLTPRGGLFVAYVILVPTVIAYLANAWALGRSSPTLVTIYIHLQAPIAALLSWVQLSELPSTRIVGAAPLIVLGVAVIAMRKSNATKSAMSADQPVAASTAQS
jgi:drug/metabolite transporter (DMT)-like permease